MSVFVCHCGCGQEIPHDAVIVAQSRGKPPKFVDRTHRKRYENQKLANRRKKGVTKR